ncbi:exodeoxyribonuclease VII small subunit [Janibacter sp. G56]|uniref:exodeoxyribonuclease VII small subunit n=1 Tax=Janibacter sp. G56 TaxID=3418717 RepID=UPI003D02E5D3
MANPSRKADSAQVDPVQEDPREADAPEEGAPHGGPQVDVSDVAGLSYEQARDELTALVARLESGQVDLEESMRLWQRGEALADHCTQWLDKAEAAVSDATPDQG